MRRFRRRGAAWAGALFAGVLVFQSSLAQSPDTLGCALEPAPSRAVAAVLDAETLRLDDGKEVRLIGALAPRASDVAADPGTWLPEEEARKALYDLVQGQTVALAFAGRREDRYGRVLAQLFLSVGGDLVWVQGRMLEAGHARAYSLPDSDACVDALLAREAVARKSRAGLWANAAYQLRPADRPTELARYRGTFQLVTGVVAGRSGSRSQVVLDFANSEANAEDTVARRSFRITAARSTYVPEVLRDAGKPVGRTALVRGWIDQRAGPQIEIVSGGQIEILDAETRSDPAPSRQ